MMCDKCKMQVATYHLRSVVNGISKEEHLCENCVESHKSSFATFVSSIFDDSFFGLDMIGFEDALCDCGTKFTDIAKSGAVGCNNCYANYKDILNEAVKSVNIGAENYRKKVESGDASKDIKIAELRNEIAKAVEIEDYERASELKKEIDKLSKEGENV